MRRLNPIATPEHEEKSLEAALKMAQRDAKRYQSTWAIFRNSEGTFLSRDLRYCSSEMDVRFVISPDGSQKAFSPSDLKGTSGRDRKNVSTGR